MRRLALGVAVLAALLGSAALGEALVIEGKARLAPVLVARAWERAVRGEPTAKPWPWADTWPVARLELPRQREAWIVLAGASGRTLAFGPAWIATDDPAGLAGHVAIAGHRDTHFRALRGVRAGDPIRLETSGGEGVRYVVRWTAVVHERDVAVLAPSAEPTLTLVTCFPFDALRPGGPLRFVVRGVAEES